MKNLPVAIKIHYSLKKKKKYKVMDSAVVQCLAQQEGPWFTGCPPGTPASLPLSKDMHLGLG